MDKNFLAILACPLCKGPLEAAADGRALVCRAEKLSFPITEDGVPCLLEEAATPLGEGESEGENDSAPANSPAEK